MKTITMNYEEYLQDIEEAKEFSKAREMEKANSAIKEIYGPKESYDLLLKRSQNLKEARQRDQGITMIQLGEL